MTGVTYLFRVKFLTSPELQWNLRRAAISEACCFTGERCISKGVIKCLSDREAVVRRTEETPMPRGEVLRSTVASQSRQEVSSSAKSEARYTLSASSVTLTDRVPQASYCGFILSLHIVNVVRAVQVHAGDGVGTGKDYTLFALKEGVVVFQKNKYIKKVWSLLLFLY